MTEPGGGPQDGDGGVERVSYLFTLADGTADRIDLEFDSAAYALRPPAAAGGEPDPAWTALDFEQCPHCPLDPARSPACPFARALSGFIHRFERFTSYDEAEIAVITARRTVTARRSLQVGMTSIVGLIGATSGCPHLAFFRPMARFHLPFADEQETLVRAFAFHLLAEYLHQGGAGCRPLSVDGLGALYAAVPEVNRGMARRVRRAFTQDAVVNAIAVLDLFAQAVPFVIEDALEELHALFGPPSPG